MEPAELMQTPLSPYDLGEFFGGREDGINQATYKNKRGLILLEYFGVIPGKNDVPRNCEICNGQMRAVSDRSRSLGWRLRCVEGHTIEPTKNTYIANIKLKIVGANLIIQAIHAFIDQVPVTKFMKYVNISSATAIAYYDYCRDVAAKIVWHEYEQIGGENDVVEVDETHLFRKKYNRGRETPWIFVMSMLSFELLNTPRYISFTRSAYGNTKGNDANQIDDLPSNGTVSNSENSDDGDRDFDINAYLYNGEKLDGVIDSEEYESDEIESEDEINNNEFNNKVKEKTFSDRESINFEEAHQNLEETLAEKLKVFDMMRGDEISFEAKRDLLIVQFGDSYLKKHRKERSSYTCSNRMRELSRLLILYRKLTNKKQVDFKDLLHPKNFDDIITTVRELSGYDHTKKSFKSPSLAMHLGTTLKLISDELIHLVLKEARGFTCKNKNEMQSWLQSIKNFRKLVESRWNIEMASLANKDLQEKKWNKPLLLPLVCDIKKFREETFKIADNCTEAFRNNLANQNDYKMLVQCLLALLIIFNRRRIGDVQYLKISDYKNDQRSNYTDFENALSATEKVLATKYRRVLNSGKGSRAVVILIPEMIEKYIKLLLKQRDKFIDTDNDYLFAVPGSKVKWGRGDVAIRNLTKKMTLKNPSAITSNKLRKQIATVMQILSLSKDDIKQFSTFMGHTQKTHEEFYELPVDVYQTAKVSKMLLMIENGVPIEHKGKNLSEIEIDTEFAEENDAARVPNDADGSFFFMCVYFEEPVTDKDGNQENNVPLDESLDEQIETPDKNNGNGSCTVVAKKRQIDLENTSLSSNMNKRKRWTELEVGLLKRNFGSFIKKKIYPSTSEIKEFCVKNNVCRDAMVVKSKLQHLIRTNTKKS
ncbi:hypothetical protein MML48_7g00007744 [Holotrichia oblita]|uniref:Uncharacterized protein n=1 Tax=Holotrichia oblita TaxID=644536 RepID=A0ACB9SRQ4_HOLOL|nr:hypothetical protein MML48_7g00007744 [Holotrichia oblita]